MGNHNAMVGHREVSDRPMAGRQEAMTEKESSIQDANSALVSVLDVQRKLLEELGTRLLPVLRPPGPQNTSVREVDTHGSDVRNGFIQGMLAVEQSNDALRELIRRVDL